MTPAGLPVAVLPVRPVWALVLFCLNAYGALCAVSVIWLSDWGRNGPGFAAGYGPAQVRAIGMALMFGLALWWLRDRLLHALLRRLAAGSGQRPAQRWGRVLALLLGAVLAVGALHWAHKLQALPGLPGTLQAAGACTGRARGHGPGPAPAAGRLPRRHPAGDHRPGAAGPWHRWRGRRAGPPAPGARLPAGCAAAGASAGLPCAARPHRAGGAAAGRSAGPARQHRQPQRLPGVCPVRAGPHRCRPARLPAAPGPSRPMTVATADKAATP